MRQNSERSEVQTCVDRELTVARGDGVDADVEQFGNPNADVPRQLRIAGSGWCAAGRGARDSDPRAVMTVAPLVRPATWGRDLASSGLAPMWRQARPGHRRAYRERRRLMRLYGPSTELVLRHRAPLYRVRPHRVVPHRIPRHPVSPQRVLPQRASEADELSVPVQRYLRNVNAEAYTWIIIGVFGFLCGAGLLAGPMMWLKGSQFRTAYVRYGLAPSKETEVAYYGGIAATVFSMLSALVFALLFGVL